MSSFISQAACHGRRPQQLIRYCRHKRPGLIAQLLRERTVARFIVGPCGYGKTSVAVEYAETVFSWHHTFWFNCKSPCFTRDLDAGIIAEECKRVDKEVQLIVFDELNVLDQTRAQQLSTEIDTLLDNSCEVLVTCSPLCDAFATLQRDRLVIGANDLLISDEELDDIRSHDDRTLTSSSDLPPTRRVPALAWGEGINPASLFLQRSFEQDMPTELMLTIASMYLLNRGMLSELAVFGGIGIDAMEYLRTTHPHLCIDVDADRFETPHFEIEDIAHAFRKRLDGMVRQSPFTSKNDLAIAWANALIDPGRSASRACDIVRLICSNKARLSWIESFAPTLVRVGCFYSSFKVIQSLQEALPKCRISTQARIAALEAICLHMLGNTKAGLKKAKRFAFSESAKRDARICCLLVIARFGTGSSRETAIASLQEVAVQKPCYPHELTLYEWLAHAQCAFAEGSEELGSFWCRQLEAGADRNGLALTASWIYQLLAETLQNGEPTPYGKFGFDLTKVEHFIRSELERAEGIGGNVFLAFATRALEHLREIDYEFVPMPLSASVLIELRGVEASLASQRRLYKRDNESALVKRNNWLDTHPDSLTILDALALAALPERNIPILSVKLFGRFEAVIEGAVLDPQFFRRQKNRTLLAILAINHDREVVRETITKSLWPSSGEETRNKNFYTVWSELKRALSLTDGTCPYLIRHQYGCSLNSRYVRSDYDRFREICHQLLFGKPDLLEWPALYDEIERNYSGELMPSERSNKLLLASRNECSHLLIDALLSGSRSIAEMGNPQWGIWFARAALSRDHTREDAYVTLMYAQIAADQRTAAMMTFLKCQKVLSEELGIDPSPETTALYRTLLESL